MHERERARVCMRDSVLAGERERECVRKKEREGEGERESIPPTYAPDRCKLQLL